MVTESQGRISKCIRQATNQDQIKESNLVFQPEAIGFFPLILTLHVLFLPKRRQST